MLGLQYSTLISGTHFIVFFLGVNITFMPLHFLGLAGMPRRISDFPDFYQGWNRLASFGSTVSLVATFIFFYVFYDLLVYGLKGRKSPYVIKAITWMNCVWSIFNKTISLIYFNLPTVSKLKLTGGESIKFLVWLSGYVFGDSGLGDTTPQKNDTHEYSFDGGTHEYSFDGGTHDYGSDSEESSYCGTCECECDNDGGENSYCGTCECDNDGGENSYCVTRDSDSVIDGRMFVDIKGGTCDVATS
jgi:hypothetical protein